MKYAIFAGWMIMKDISKKQRVGLIIELKNTRRAKTMSNNYRPTIDEALESVEKLDDMIDMLDYGGALSTDEVDEACMALTTIKLYIQSSVPRAE